MNGQRILMGVVGRPHGVRGLVHVHSYASVPEDLAGYGPLLDDRGMLWTLQWHGNGIAELGDVQGRTLHDRDAAQVMVNRRLYVDRDRLPEPGEDEFYLADLVGLAAHEHRDGMERSMGTVLAVHDYGAGASLEIGHVGHSALVPFTRVCVPRIDLAAGSLVIVQPEHVELARDPR